MPRKKERSKPTAAPKAPPEPNVKVRFKRPAHLAGQHFVPDQEAEFPESIAQSLIRAMVAVEWRPKRTAKPKADVSIADAEQA